MQSLANRLAIQHFVNAYTQETGKGHLLNKTQQTPQQKAFSQGLTLLSIPINSIHAQCDIPLSYVSRVGRHRVANLLKLQSQVNQNHSAQLQSLGYYLKNWFLNHLYL